jgi:hypothetical protein
MLSRNRQKAIRIGRFILGAHEVGSNGDECTIQFGYNNAKWGSMGMNDVSLLEMGITGGGRGIGDRRIAEIAVIGNQ